MDDSPNDNDGDGIPNELDNDDDNDGDSRNHIDSEVTNGNHDN